MLISAPVAGLRPVRAARSARSKVRKPGSWTLSPLATASVTTPSNAASISPTDEALWPVFWAIALTSSVLFIGSPFRWTSRDTTVSALEPYSVDPRARTRVGSRVVVQPLHAVEDGEHDSAGGENTDEHDEYRLFPDRFGQGDHQREGHEDKAGPGVDVRRQHEAQAAQGVDVEDAGQPGPHQDHHQDDGADHADGQDEPVGVVQRPGDHVGEHAEVGDAEVDPLAPALRLDPEPDERLAGVPPEVHEEGQHPDRRQGRGDQGPPLAV